MKIWRFVYPGICTLLAIVGIVLLIEVALAGDMPSRDRIGMLAFTICILQGAVLGLMHHRHGRSAVTIRWSARLSAVLLIALTVIAGLARGVVRDEGYILIGLFAVMLLVSFTPASCRSVRDRQD